MKLQIVKWNGRIHCAYFNNNRIAGPIPWGGGKTVIELDINLKELLQAVDKIDRDELYEALKQMVT